MRTFQQIILTLQDHWDKQGRACCNLLTWKSVQVPATPPRFLRAIGPEPWKAAYVQSGRRPKDGRYGENPNRLQHYYHFKWLEAGTPPIFWISIWAALRHWVLTSKKNDIRFVETIKNPTLGMGAWLGGLVERHGGHAVHHFQQVGGIDCKPATGEITYGLERLAMYLQSR